MITARAVAAAVVAVFSPRTRTAAPAPAATTAAAATAVDATLMMTMMAPRARGHHPPHGAHGGARDAIRTSAAPAG